MSSNITHFCSEEIEHLSNGIGKMGRKYKSSRGSNHNGFTCSSPSLKLSQNGWDSDEDELKEEDVWGGQGSTSCWDHSSYQQSNASSVYSFAAENGCTSKGSKGRESRLTMELRAVDAAVGKKEHVGVGFAALEAVQNDGWAPGFSMRKVKIPQCMGAGSRRSEYNYGWHQEENGGKHRGVPQSAPVSVPIWLAKLGYGESNGLADADDCSGGEDDGLVDDCSNEDHDGDDDNEDLRSGRLAPHEIVDRDYARSQSTTFSVIEGAGRTLKGMDLRRVRNAVWSCTGFED